MNKSPLTLENWQVKKIGVIGPGIVGMPMAALLANANIKIGSDDPAKVVVVQRNSPTSGWKVESINAGKSVIGGVEPALDDVVKTNVEKGLLSASYNYSVLSDADVVLICVQTDKKGFGPDYGPLFEALRKLAEAFQNKPEDKTPVVVFESTLAPSTMATVIKKHFADYGLVEGKDILLGNSPNRVMPGRLVERVTESDKIVAGLSPITPQLVKRLYAHIVTKGHLYDTNSMTAEVVKTLENAYRDVRIAYSAEVVRYCDENDIDFYALRDKVNANLNQSDSASQNANAVPVGGLLVPTTGVGGHCLPKDGILLWWRRKDSGVDMNDSMIWNARVVNDESPAETIKLAERAFGPMDNKRVALLGAAYRFNSEDTRNSPTFPLAKQLLEKGCQVTIQDPYVKPGDQNLVKFDLDQYFTNDVEYAVGNADYVFICTGHRDYFEIPQKMKQIAPQAKGLVDAGNMFKRSDMEQYNFQYTGIGKGTKKPTDEFVNFVETNFKAVEFGFANEIGETVDFLNKNYAADEFNKVDFSVVQELAGSCTTGCDIVDRTAEFDTQNFSDFKPRLVECAEKTFTVKAETV